MPKLDVGHVIRDGVLTLGGLHYLVRRRVEKLCLFVNELLDEPRARDSVHARSRARYPFHLVSLPAIHRLSSTTFAYFLPTPHPSRVLPHIEDRKVEATYGHDGRNVSPMHCPVA